MGAAITAETVLSEVATMQEAKAIARDMRATALAVEGKYGEGHPIAQSFTDRYFDFVDAMAEKFGT